MLFVTAVLGLLGNLVFIVVFTCNRRNLNTFHRFGHSSTKTIRAELKQTKLKTYSVSLFLTNQTFCYSNFRTFIVASINDINQGLFREDQETNQVVSF